ncbi:hypothetical protein K432DRAFT_465993 [Lepidopterella palustris CBS 459.81]|uniref:Uncharacterized protein n=1 Tax=Lepidopterella palustris CBS 459.81 TaxID=1314670 RepID=A0A8E2EGQ4_9PEZI|nr:hypothetical protein K432DRAFT_465993 [Lepidopterella palustris CBS 459.81]
MLDPTFLIILLYGHLFFLPCLVLYAFPSHFSVHPSLLTHISHFKSSACTVATSSLISGPYFNKSALPLHTHPLLSLLNLPMPLHHHLNSAGLMHRIEHLQRPPPLHILNQLPLHRRSPLRHLQICQKLHHIRPICLIRRRDIPVPDTVQ